MDNGKNVPFRKEGDVLYVKPFGFRYGTSLCVRVAEIRFEEN